MDILLTGSVAYDYLMTFPGHFKEQILPERLESISLSFLVDSMQLPSGRRNHCSVLGGGGGFAEDDGICRKPIESDL